MFPPSRPSSHTVPPVLVAAQPCICMPRLCPSSLTRARNEGEAVRSERRKGFGSRRVQVELRCPAWPCPRPAAPPAASGGT